MNPGKRSRIQGLRWDANPSHSHLLKKRYIANGSLWKMGDPKINIVYNDKTDLLYIRFDDSSQEVINRRISEDIVLDDILLIELRQGTDMDSKDF